MAQENLGKFVGGFGEAFFKTLQSERERQDKLNQMNQEFSQKSREMNLLNAYRNKYLDMQGRQPFVTEDGTVFPSEGGVPDFTKPLWQMPPTQEKTKPTTYSKLEPFKMGGLIETKYQEGQDQPLEYGTWFKPDSSNSNGSGNGTSNTESTTPYVNFDSVDEAIRNYNQRTEDGVAVGDKVVPVDMWRTQVNEKLEENLRDAGISQEVSDKIWELAGIKDSDNAVTKRKKLKNVLDQQSQLPDFQRRALYQMVEVRTR